MAGSRLLDTNAISAFLDKDLSIQKLTFEMDLLIPSIALGEFYFGIYKSSKVEENLKGLNTFLSGKTVLVCDATTGMQYGQIKQRLRAKGRPIPENDIWIAAIAKQHNLILVTRDQHFKEVDGLDIESW